MNQSNRNKDVKQVIVIRKDLKMRQGKACAQSAHASLKVILDKMYTSYVSGNTFEGYKKKTIEIPENGPLDLWINGIFKKITVYVNSEQELLDIYNKAKELDMYCALIQDNGLTEFNNVPTYTCCAIGPEFAEKIDELTGKLPLL